MPKVTQSTKRIEIDLLDTPAYKKAISIGILYPNLYSVAMSNLGFHQLYRCFRSTGLAFVKRWYYHPRNITEGLPVNPPIKLRDHAFIFITINYELDVFHLLQMLIHEQIPPLRGQRKGHPILIIGGALVKMNVGLFTEIADWAIPHDLEEVESILIEVVQQSLLNSYEALQAILEEGKTSSNRELPPHDVSRQYKPAFTTILSNQTTFSNHFLIEIARGCPYRCKFCSTQRIYDPYSSFAPENLFTIIEERVVQNKSRLPEFPLQIGMVSASTTSHNEIITIIQQINRWGLQAGVSSIRLDHLNDEMMELIYQNHQRTLTLAPETGNDALRASINKRFTNQKIMDVIQRAYRIGFRKIKLYFMIGLPNESVEDVLSILDLIQQAMCFKGIRIEASVNIFIPKVQSAFQSEPLIHQDEYLTKLDCFKRNEHHKGFPSLQIMKYRDAELQYRINHGSSDVIFTMIDLIQNQRPIKNLLYPVKIKYT